MKSRHSSQKPIALPRKSKWMYSSRWRFQHTGFSLAGNDYLILDARLQVATPSFSRRDKELSRHGSLGSGGRIHVHGLSKNGGNRLRSNRLDMDPRLDAGTKYHQGNV